MKQPNYWDEGPRMRRKLNFSSSLESSIGPGRSFVSERMVQIVNTYYHANHQISLRRAPYTWVFTFLQYTVYRTRKFTGFCWGSSQLKILIYKTVLSYLLVFKGIWNTLIRAQFSTSSSFSDDCVFLVSWTTNRQKSGDWGFEDLIQVEKHEKNRNRLSDMWLAPKECLLHINFKLNSTRGW